MSLVYFDSSAFVKLLVEETGSDLAERLWNDCSAVVSSRLAYPEVRAALAAANRDRRLSAVDLVRANQTWERVWAAVRAVELTAELAGHSGDLAEVRQLRGADAVHLASAYQLADISVVVAVWDHRLNRAVQRAGFATAPKDFP